MYSALTKVTHINEIANVPSTLVEAARQQGKAWDLRRIPVGRGNPLKVMGTRLQDLLRWFASRRGVDLVHVHYAANGYYGWGRKPFVLHLHGSDVRKDWQKPGLRQVISHSLRRADAVICATPDLLAWVSQVRPDAKWVPNPLPLEFFNPSAVTAVPGRVVFSSRWDETKGLDLLLPLARLLVASGIEVHGLDWGSHAGQAREAGVILHPLMALPDFADFLASASVVVGQLQFPALSMTDYQTLALGRPLLCSASVESAPTGSAPVASVVAPGEDFPNGVTDCFPRDPELLADWIGKVLGAPDDYEQAASRREWVHQHHHPQQVVTKLEEIYQELLSI